MPEASWLSLLPPLVAIGTALLSRQVYLSLFVGVWLGWTLLAGGNPLLGLGLAIQACVDVFKDAGNTRVILFSALVGGLIALTQRSGGVAGFVQWVVERGLVRTRRGAELLAASLGLGIFVESSITSLISGTVARPLFDRWRIPREKLAYICDSTSAPVCILIPLNGWGAFILGLLITQQVALPVATLVASIPYNFYALLALAYVFYVVLSGRDWGPMRAAEQRARDSGALLAADASPLVSGEVLALQPRPGVIPRARNMLVPLSAMLIMMPLGLWLTGDGNLMQGSGSTSVLWAVLTGITVAGLMSLQQRIFSLGEVMNLLFQGVGALVPLAVLMMLAFAIGATCTELGTGTYVAGLAGEVIHPGLLPLVLFLSAALIAFSTGTSFGTFAIMLPIAVPVAGLLDLDLPLMVGAVLAGGIFGDHCSPISDTTVISSMAAGSDHMDHVRTQLPYALLVALFSSLLYLAFGLLG